MTRRSVSHKTLCLLAIMLAACRSGLAQDLFLAHYNQSLNADFALQGDGRAEGVGQLTSGGVGFAFKDSRPRAEAADVGYSDNSPKAGLKYNMPVVDLRQGTVELWVKTNWDWRKAPGAQAGPEHSFLFIPLEAGGASRVELYVASKNWGGEPTLVFLIYDGQVEPRAATRITSLPQTIDWHKDVWHYLAACWTPIELRLFCDGQLVARGTSDPPLAKMRTAEAPWYVGNFPDSLTVPAHALIDEVRVSARALYMDREQIPVPQQELIAQAPTQPVAAPSPPAPARALREAPAWPTSTAPIVDGNLSDPIWRELPRASGFADITFHQAYVLDQTLWAACYDQRNLYLAIQCNERFPRKIKAEARSRDGSVFSDDCLEVFVSPHPGGQPYYQLAVNSAGTQYDGKGIDASWNGDWQARAKIGDRSWMLEVAIPFTTLGVSPPRPGEVYRINLCRDRLTEKKDPYSTWARLTSGFHAPNDFGRLIFAASDAKPQRSAELEWNADLVNVTRTEARHALKRARRELLLASRVNQRAKPPTASKMEQGVNGAAQRLESDSALARSLDDYLAVRALATDLVAEGEKLALELGKVGPAGPSGLPSVGWGLSRKGGYWYFASSEAIFAVDGRTGAMVGLWDRKRKQRCLASSFDVYTIETAVQHEQSDERMDTVSKANAKGEVLSLVCANPDLPRAMLTKRYWLQSGGRSLSKELAVSGEVEEKTLLSVSSRTLFDEAFRAPSYYNRVMTCGSTGGADKPPSVPASQVTEPRLQRGGFNSPSGWSQFDLVNLKTGTGVAQYLFKLNGEFIWIPYSVNMSYWTPYGWEMAWTGCFLQSRPFVAEQRYHLFRGDQLTFKQEYLSLPEFQAAWASYNPDPRMARMHAEGYSDNPMHYRALVEEEYEKRFVRASIPYRWLRSDECMVSLTGPSHTWLGAWPGADVEEFQDKRFGAEARFPVTEVKKAVSRCKQHFPRYLIGYYWWPWHVAADSAMARNHPEFAVHDRQGKPLETDLAFAACPGKGYQVNWSPECRAYMLERFLKHAENLGVDFVYLDNGGGYAVPDWLGERVIQPTDVQAFFRDLQRELRKRGKFLWVNGDTGHMFCDLGYIEGLAVPTEMERWWGKGWWRPFGEMLLDHKLFSRPGVPWVLLYWQDYRDPAHRENPGTNNREYTNCILKLGLQSHSCYYEYYEDLKQPDGQTDWSAMYYYEEPYHAATLEIAESRLANVGLEPAFWRDFQTPIEAYCLSQGPAHLFTTTYHPPEGSSAPMDVTLTADRQRLGLKSGAPLFIWEYQRRDDSQVRRRAGPPPEGWDRLFRSINCRLAEVPKEPRFRLTMGDVPPEHTQIVSVTQAPAVIASLEGKATQFLLPQLLGCGVTGSVDASRRTVAVEYKGDKPAEILIYFPEAWGKAEVTVQPARGLSASVQPVSEDYRRFDNLRFVRVSVPAGEVRIRARPAG